MLSPSSGLLDSKFKTPAGKPASITASTTKLCVLGLTSEALNTTLFPQTIG